jgi:hypothetical protein
MSRARELQDRVIAAWEAWNKVVRDSGEVRADICNQALWPMGQEGLEAIRNAAAAENLALAAYRDALKEYLEYLGSGAVD